MDKYDHIVNDFYPQNPQKVFYPIDRHGVVDEWDALVKNQTYLEEQHAKKRAEEQKQKKLQYKHDLEMMKKMKEDEKQREKDKLRAEREELKYLDKELEEYNKMRKSMDRQLKNQTAIDLLNQVGRDKSTEDNIRQRDQNEMNDRINQFKLGEQNAKIKDLEKKANQAKEMRDFYAYKQFQKDLEREKALQDKMDYNKMLQDENRKKEEKERQWRKFYEDFAHQQQGKINDYTQNVIAPHNEKERMLEMKRLQDREQIAAKAQGEMMGQMGKKAMSQAEIDDFNRRQLEMKNRREQEEKQKNLQYANQRGQEISIMDNLTDQQKQELINQKRLYGQTLLYQQQIQDQLRRNYGKMTMHEKQLNKVDLRAYKNLEGQVYAAVPGIHHFDTVGSQPLAHKGAPQMDLESAAAGRTQRQDFNNTLRDQNMTYKRKQMELEMKQSHGQLSPNGIFTFQSNYIAFQTIGGQPMTSQSVDFKNQPAGMSRYRSQTTLGDAANVFEITHKNPIWNPLPNYHQRVFNPISYNNNTMVPSTTKSVLQTMAQNNIFN
ncbi:UNKNOWN [Stylonychia lemnae]|uniref:Uncharacterized protein n=1 Tax=Stylonychia lemnae TaxID=5949 RepID=A0A078AFU5_STYLE|nr:UNKNOWN [Stylonychia lemnae]|eukprot:CDW79763.1 UNKNOWN [Stylonychia lemnae]